MSGMRGIKTPTGSNNIAQGLAPVVGWASTHYMPLTGAHKKQRHHHLFAPYRGVFFVYGHPFR